jgi:NAD(P)-dependent dehydrogenase (short-subunit alcohol dehydrogenase family)
MVRCQIERGGDWSLEDVKGKVAFITGGGSGVGLGMAKAFSAAGMKVVIADIRQDHLDEAMAQLAGPAAHVHPILLDVTDREAMASAADESERVFGKVHVVCNNAGINLFNDVGSATYQDWDWVLGVNLGGVVNGVVTFVPRIRAHGEGGHIVNTASMASFISGPAAGIYTASKFAVRGLSEALRWSLVPHGIGVSVLCPGLVQSSIYESERTRPAHLSTDTAPVDQELMRHLPEVQQAGMAPEEVGEKVLRAIRRNDFYIFTHPEFDQELREIFDEALAALPHEPVPAARLAFEEGRRAAKAEARALWPD